MVYRPRKYDGRFFDPFELYAEIVLKGGIVLFLLLLFTGLPLLGLIVSIIYILIVVLKNWDKIVTGLNHLFPNRRKDANAQCANGDENEKIVETEIESAGNDGPTITNLGRSSMTASKPNDVKSFQFRFVDGPKQYGNGIIRENTNAKGLADALQRGYMNRGDRGTIAVCLFNIHGSSAFQDSRRVRETADGNQLKIIVEALVSEVTEHNWERHRFCEFLRANDKDLLKAISDYGVSLSLQR
jgi:hypothetical protein